MRSKIFRWKAIGPLLLLSPDPGHPGLDFCRAGGPGYDRGGQHRAARNPGGCREARSASSTSVGRPERPADRGSVRAHPQPHRGRRDPAQAQSRGAGGEEARDREPEPAAACGSVPRGRSRPARSRGEGSRPRCTSRWSSGPNSSMCRCCHSRPIDTIRQLALDPTQLTTIREAQALLARTDSARKALDQGFQQLDIGPTLDSARALAEQLGQDRSRRSSAWTVPGRRSSRCSRH